MEDKMTMVEKIVVTVIVMIIILIAIVLIPLLIKGIPLLWKWSLS